MLYQLVVFLHVVFVFGYLLAHGVIAAFMGGWWGRVWPWLSLGLGVVIIVLMALFGAGLYGEARKAAGLRYNFKGKWFSAEPAQSDEAVLAILAKTHPVLLTGIGYGGFAVITWLMMAKPF